MSSVIRELIAKSCLAGLVNFEASLASRREHIVAENYFGFYFRL
jgi:hypothetical protein